jgi:hypothetical protein
MELIFSTIFTANWYIAMYNIHIKQLNNKVMIGKVIELPASIPIPKKMGTNASPTVPLTTKYLISSESLFTSQQSELNQLTKRIKLTLCTGNHPQLLT